MFTSYKHACSGHSAGQSTTAAAFGRSARRTFADGLRNARSVLIGALAMAALLPAGQAGARTADIRGYTCVPAPDADGSPPRLGQRLPGTEDLEPICPAGKVPQPAAKSAPKGRPVSGAPPVFAAPLPGYSYAGKRQSVREHHGTFAFLRLAGAPLLQDGTGHSLAEIAVHASNDGRDIVEIGWTVGPLVYGDTQPRLFVFHWIDGVDQCYNGCGYVQTSTTMAPGMTVPVTGAAPEYRIQVSAEGWNVYYGGERLGFFPHSRWGGSFRRSGFHQWFGEVNSPAAVPCTDMGNGIYGRRRGAARIENVRNVVNNRKTRRARPDRPHNVTNPSWYNVSSSRSFGFGGPGGC